VPAAPTYSTKLRPPTLPADFVARPRVHELLTEGRGRRLTLVCAPAGFGKTIALAGWLHESGRPWAWVSLDELDSDLVTFTSVLVSALGTVIPNAGHQALALAAQAESPSGSELSALLADDLAGPTDDLVVVLDDVHLIQEPSIHALLSMLVRRLPPTIQLVIASREEPPLSLALLRGRCELAEVLADDLRFDRAEAVAFVRGTSGDQPDQPLIADTVDRSEGWAAGLRLLTLISSSTSAQTSTTRAAARERQFVDAYLFEEVLSRQTPELRRFLTHVSILDRFCAPLCEAVVDGLQPGDAQRLLDASMAAGLFLMSLDVEQRWFRFHHLFRDMLRRRLERDAGPEQVGALRLRASDWLAGQALWDEAATHAIDANDVDRVTALVETCLLTDRSIGTGLRLDAWTRRLPREVVEESPTLLLARSGRRAFRGEIGELESDVRRIDAMLAGEPSRMGPALLPIARGQTDMQLAWVLHQMGGADHEALARLERALDLLPMDQHDYRGAAASLYGITLQCLGQTDDALAWISTQRNGGATLHPDFLARLHVCQLYVELASGRLAAAAHTGRRMVALGYSLKHPLVIGWGHFALGSVAYEWNDLSAAREHFEAVLALGRGANRMFSVNATLGLARTLVAQGEPAEAERLALAELEQAEKAGNTSFLEGFRSFMARLSLASNDLDRAAYWLAGVTFARQGTTAFDIEDSLLTRARVLVARATSAGLDEATAAVDRVVEAAAARHVTSSLVQGLALRALVEQRRGDYEHAARSLARALELAEPGGFTRAFVDLGSALTGVLLELEARGRLPTGGERVLEACRAESGVQAPPLPSRDRVAPQATLTWRELDVLNLLDGHHTNKEIARLLTISDETVKKHAANIYSKLQVKGRREAVVRAYELGILRADARRAPRSA
jgi:LuxR family maltose regulon positive regulatory protein